MKRFLALTLGGAAFILAFPPAIKAQEVEIGPGGVTIHRHHRHSRDYWERDRERQRELWRERFYDRHGYYPD